LTHPRKTPPGSLPQADGRLTFFFSTWSVEESPL
jgi:hypothetical protein